ncbi:MAG: PDZ domain-containing protein [Planctomycetia bacterium]|nr:PDZ domain-containing protein [Planctomycetia bacterium]
MKSLAYLLAGSLLLTTTHVVWAQQALERLEGQVRAQIAPGPRLEGAPRPAADGEPGYLGVVADDRQQDGPGLRLVNVVAGGPAAKAGLKVDDVITGVEGQAVRSMNEFAERMTGVPPGGKVTLTVRRGDKEQPIDVVLGRRPATAPRATGAAEPTPTPRPSSAAARPAPLGVRVLPVTEEARLALGVPTTRGAMVVNVTEGSAAEKAGIPLESVIVEIDGRRVDSPDDAARILGQVSVGQTLKISLYHRGELMERDVTVRAASASAQDAGRAPAAQPPRPFSAGPLVEDSASRVEQLERRVVELEKRLEALQRSLEKLTKDATSNDQPLPEPAAPKPE